MQSSRYESEVKLQHRAVSVLITMRKIDKPVSFGRKIKNDSVGGQCQFEIEQGLNSLNQQPQVCPQRRGNG
jgi:hypothetical protein